MKTLTRIKSALLASLVFAFASPDKVQGAFTYNATDYNDGYSVTHLVDGARNLFLVLNRGAQAYTAVDIGVTGNWVIYDWYVLDDGTLVLHWGRNTATGVELAMWRITNGALVSAAGYSTSGWAPITSMLVPYGGAVGDKDLRCFTNPGPTQIAAWLISANGIIEKTFAWALASGWAINAIYTSEDASLFTVEWLGNGLAYYTFDGNGNWIGANSY